MNLNKGIRITLPMIQGTIYGGSYRDYVPGTRRLVGVKMAVEINKPCDVSVPTKDFHTPDVKTLQDGIIRTLELMSQGNDVYVGCMGGIGRTGLFMACLFKAVNHLDPKPGENFDPILFVRASYNGHAVETDEQEAYVADFDIAPIVDAYRAMVERNTIVKTVEKRVEVPVEVPVVVTEYLTPWQWLLDLWARFWASMAGTKKA